MCGLIGILGHHSVCDRLIAGLERLEYRGYDSAGISVINGKGVARRRAVGKVAELRALLDLAPVKGLSGIAHTRWATHGAPTETNAHPHDAGPVTVVHNGIIENHAALRARLEESGVRFASETDTEVVAQLCAWHLARSSDGAPEAAVRATMTELRGSYALAFLFADRSDLMIVARQGSPLAIGYGAMNAAGACEMYVGSDALALAPFTTQISYLEDGDLAVITRHLVRIFDGAAQEVTRAVHEIPAETARAEKGPHRHYMHKEIHEQPESLTRALRGLLDLGAGRVGPILDGVNFTATDRIVLVGCGTAHYACHLAKYWLEELAGICVEVEIASEMRYRAMPTSGREVAIFVSQSGETADTLAALRKLRGRVAHRVAVINVATSSIARESEYVIDIQAGPEIGVASTKAFTGQLVALAALALKAARDRGRLDGEAESSLVEGLVALPRLVGEVLANEGEVETLAQRIAPARAALFLGRGAYYPLSLEAALKLKEISYIHAEGYAAGELKHGPIALVDENVPVVVFAPQGPHLDKTLSNAAEVAARGGGLIILTDNAASAAQRIEAETIFEMPRVPQPWGPIAHAAVAQLIAYHVAVLKGTDVDQPRNLAKSVTVE